MEPPPSSWAALCALAFVLGAKHGFDADRTAVVAPRVMPLGVGAPRSGS